MPLFSLFVLTFLLVYNTLHLWAVEDKIASLQKKLDKALDIPKTCQKGLTKSPHIVLS